VFNVAGDGQLTLRQIARQIGMNVIVNTVLNRKGEVVGAFFGDTVEAFNEGVKLSKEVYAVEIPEEADIVISSLSITPERAGWLVVAPRSSSRARAGAPKL